MAAALVACVLLVAFWEVMSARSRRPFHPFGTTARDFQGFSFAVPGRIVRDMPVPHDPIEPNILAFQAIPAVSNSGPATGGTVWVRLVHGYNMYDCMRMKHYRVDLLEDRRIPAPGSAGGTGQPSAFVGQIWRLTSSRGETAIWATSMLRASDLTVTGTDVRSMAFPRIGVPGDPDWVSDGFRLEDLRHPVRNLRMRIQVKWNNSRCDWLTFLGLRQPAWASDELHTLLTFAMSPTESGSAVERAVTGEVIRVHLAAAAAFQEWKAERAKPAMQLE